MRDFEPHPLLRNVHAMIITGALLPRRFPRLPRPERRLFDVEPRTQLLARCHWQARRAESPTLVLVHGLEGSSESPHIRGTAEKAFVSGFNVVRLNQRNCGGSDRLTPTLYNSGLSADYRAVLETLIESDGLRKIFFAGFSMGGNLVLKMAGELPPQRAPVLRALGTPLASGRPGEPAVVGAEAPAALRGVCAVCPSFDLAACVDAIGEPRNALYQWHFVRSLKARMRRKARLFPQLYALDGLNRVRTVREFDGRFTAPHCGYRDADDYYERASAARVLARIAVPTLILTAQDDPFVPFASFNLPQLAANSNIALMAPKHGGHCAFISRSRGWERYWAEARIVEWCAEHISQT